MKDAPPGLTICRTIDVRPFKAQLPGVGMFMAMEEGAGQGSSRGPQETCKYA